MVLSACIEWQFAQDHDTLADRVRAAKAAGLGHAEFHLWRDKDMAGLATALDETGVTLTGFCVDPRRSIVDPAQHEEMLQAVAETLAIAKTVGSPPLIVASGFIREGVSMDEHKAQAVHVLRRAADLAEAAQVTLVLEPLNDRVEHPGMYLVDTTLALDIIEAVGSPRLKLLYDVYHSHVMGEDMRSVLAGRMHLVEHVQVADSPGRNEPGTGTIDWAQAMATLRDLGYSGPFGLEYRPTLEAAASLAASRKVLGD
ncbi:MAG: hydroxypyruvate isomerase [Novosphingobium sp. 28-62-57]|uniref:TIM barrel protein n=1 Tax=unclassified Novosphingobium TaxID=2644732 RepID=UPI000BCDBA75|nr:MULTISPECIES: TIM barrel protein [unclassified Novosphingobium]OYW51275.1 MAG: hydroxypyruvate isomerase [Novosphingobium sp. 12-62-10]OYZ45701.1 MAG: hydroxypyruvate isomerase [Novosphingobium sp. 16-62-11]OZA37194.1 MAG: hydroxypyruvate isomerase [Novosphingobium sp. 17-62-9]OYZ10344.1 MAG: hydroxypyruvate isomerase [Novosphingobium sp. 28-62-57]HQS68063.1 TIM barrel protein [Novosphingobium sp.]